jgi:uncharacterized protein
MLSSFYKKHSRAILWIVALSFPILAVRAGALRGNNDIETWLPHDSPVRATYEQFKRDFGVEEIVLVGISRESADDALIESISGRLDRLPGVRKCWSPARLRAVMADLGVSESDANARIHGLALSRDGSFTGLIVSLSENGLRNRTGTVHDIERELDYCRLNGDGVCLTGAPVIVTELDRLGGQQENRKFFFVTLIICLGLLYYWIHDWKLSLAVLGLTLWAIELTLAIFEALGGQMNFILGALSIMVMIFTLEAAIHILHYYKASLGCDDPLGQALKLSWKPCLVSMITTVIGLFSISVTDIVPVTQFCYASALGAIVAILTGVLITPAVLCVLPVAAAADEAEPGGIGFVRLGNWLMGSYRKVVWVSGFLVLAMLAGLFRLETKIDPLDFLPKQSKAMRDVEIVEKKLTNIDSIEAVVDFSGSELAFVDRLKQVRGIEQTLRKHPSVRHTMSASAFFPEQLPENALSLMKVLQKAEARRGNNEFIVGDERLWRISARIDKSQGKTVHQVYHDLQEMTSGQPVHFTGIAPLLEQAQHEIFDGFWKSFTSAFVVLLVVMVLFLRSLKMAVLAMIPNIAPLCVVFGFLGWTGLPVDIGIMMTASIALGISVDGTFHYLVRYQEQCDLGRSGTQAVRVALLTTGGPIFESIVVSSIGMLALTLSSFAPTARFGLLMASLLVAALAGDLLLLPSLLALRPLKRAARQSPRRPAIAERSLAATHGSGIPADRVA